MSPKGRQFDEKVINEVRKRVRFQVNTFKITGREPFVSFVIINLVRRNLSLPTLRAKDILQSFSMKVSDLKN